MTPKPRKAPPKPKMKAIDKPVKSANPVGRPSVYSAIDLTEWLDEYVTSNDDPYIEDFCLIRRLSPDTIYRYAKESDRLSEAIKRCHDKQKMRTVKKAEVGEINATFAIFKLKQKCYGWTDKQEIESVNINLNSEMSVEEANEYLKSQGVKI